MNATLPMKIEGLGSLIDFLTYHGHKYKGVSSFIVLDRYQKNRSNSLIEDSIKNLPHFTLKRVQVSYYSRTEALNHFCLFVSVLSAHGDIERESNLDYLFGYVY